MTQSILHIASQPIIADQSEVKGYVTRKDDEEFFCIENYHLMDPFFMSIVSSSDLWMYLSSSGGLTAGRQNYNNAIFPYETDDKIHSSANITGPKTIVRLKEKSQLKIWEPFSDKYSGLYHIQRNLYKNTSGSRVIFEETNVDLKLVFSYSWMSSDELGWVRKSELKNLSSASRELDVTDGLQNLLPWGITRETQSMMSTLMDAYKVSEYLPESGLALYRMSSIPVDRAEPSEALAANTVWTCGLKPDKVLLGSKQLNRLYDGKPLETETLLYGQKMSFFIHADLKLQSNDTSSWFIVADVAKEIPDVISLQHLMTREQDLASFIEKSVMQSERTLLNLVGMADGLQETNDSLNDRRHFANVMFNIMRGGIFSRGYDMEIKDFLDHLQTSNKGVFNNSEKLYSDLNPVIKLDDLLAIAHKQKDSDLLRLTLEYLPLSFSRRHGDPSRPWNFFDINMKKDDGSPSLNYQGNWRDIFQNWETLGFSFPAFFPGMIAKFLNASTADGYNPYRVLREGFDWEVPEPDNPWAFIGYWGDHQIIYLLRLIEMQQKFYPGSLLQNMNTPDFVYANVPYRIKDYHQIVENAQDTIVFDRHLHEELMEKSKTLGSDGKLVFSHNGEPQRATFTEKILVSLLTKLSNLIPEAGIWLNTQRPEWNDANNALVGNGASMVTLYHLRRYITFFSNLTQESKTEMFTLSDEVFDLFADLHKTLSEQKQFLEKGFSDTQRKIFVDRNGIAAGNYREKIYKGFSGQQTMLSRKVLLKFYALAIEYLDQSIHANLRTDDMYHSYNLVALESNSISIQNLELMLEGQVAILNSGMLSAGETNRLIDALFVSGLWREDQQSFMLYPFKKLPDFLSKNAIPQDIILSSAILKKLIDGGNTDIVKADANGEFHFRASLKNSRLLEQSLIKVMEQIQLKTDKVAVQDVLDIYEQVFNHRAFTGRSGSFYKYEGLGSIYWHMVSKLLLAVGENIMTFSADEKAEQFLPALKKQYYRIKDGIGLHKNPPNYGAFPTDPYSHTPSMMGAQQPGMTGQVKEDILSRFNELGLVVKNGEIHISPHLMKDEDFIEGQELSLSFCNTPFIYNRSREKGIKIYLNSGIDTPLKFSSLTIPAEISADIFNRSGKIMHVLVNVD